MTRYSMLLMVLSRLFCGTEVTGINPVYYLFTGYWNVIVKVNCSMYIRRHCIRRTVRFKNYAQNACVLLRFVIGCISPMYLRVIH